MNLELPPQPKLADYKFDGKFEEKAYKEALAAWREVCRELVEAHKSGEFWNGRA